MKHTVKSVIAAGLLALSSASSAAVIQFQDFTINAGLYGGTGLKTGDKLNGGYKEQLQVLPGSMFAATAIATFNSLYENDGADLVSFTGLGDRPIIAVLFSSGTVSTSGTSFTSTNNQISFYLDVGGNTKSVLNGAGAPTFTNNSDDVLLGKAGTAPSVGTGDTVGPPGAFNIDFFDVSLTDAGKAYFVSPNPFYVALRTNGDIDALSEVVGSPGLFQITGDISANFVKVVPEPASLALLGLGLIGAGAVRRRQKSA